MPPLWALVPLVLLAAAPAAPAHPPCGRLPAGESAPVPVWFHAAGTRLRSAVVVCDGRRRVVLRRARVTLDRTVHWPRGTLVGAAAAAGRRVAWIEARFAHHRRTATVVVATVPRRGRPRVLERRVVRRDRSRLEPALGVLITRHGALAWLAGRPERAPVVVKTPGSPPRVVARDGSGDMALEDRRTLRWAKGYGFGFADLAPWPATGCPRRSRFGVVADTPTVRVTRAIYRVGPERAITAVRACLRASGLDPVVGEDLGPTTGVRLAGLDRQWVVLVYDDSTRGPVCADERVQVVVAGSGAVGRDAPLRYCFGPEPQPPYLSDALAVADGVAVAWVTRDADAERLVAFPRSGGPVELDRGPIGAIAGLRAEGLAVTWTNAGTARSADLG
jgi:hypothetical protein